MISPADGRSRLLIVDDAPDVIKILLGMLSDDYDLSFATSGPRALALLAQGEKPDLILLDVMMPEMDGYAVCAALKQAAETRDIPVIFVTVRTDADSETRALTAGAVDFIHKPLNCEVVRARVKLHLELTQHRDCLEDLVDIRTRELAEARDAAEGANRAKSAFLASVSHELRTPLTAILGLTEALRIEAEGTPEHPSLPTLTLIEQSGRQLLGLINGIIDLSRLEAGETELQIGPCSLMEFGQASVRLARNLAESKQQTVDFPAPSPDVLILADGRRLKQALDHLLNNAVKFTPEGGRLGLDIAGDPAAEVVRLTVWDTGIGIAPEQLPNLFETFVQLDARRARQYPGTGLGLAVVRKIVELHGGRVEVDSTPGRGSRFTVTLPWRKPALDEI